MRPTLKMFVTSESRGRVGNISISIQVIQALSHASPVLFLDQEAVTRLRMDMRATWTLIKILLIFCKLLFRGVQEEVNTR